MENWHVDPITRLMIARLPTGNYLVGDPTRGVVSYGPEEVEHVTLRGSDKMRVIKGHPVRVST